MNICMKLRAQRAKAALTNYYRIKGEPLDCIDAGITDLMTDLMHLAHREGLDGFQLSRMAQGHFLVEEEMESQRGDHTTNTTSTGE